MLKSRVSYYLVYQFIRNEHREIPMRAGLVAFATAVSMVIMWPAIAPHQSTTSAQAPVTQAGQAGQGQPAGQQGRRRFRQSEHADLSRAAGRHAGAADRSVHVEELLQRSRRSGRTSAISAATRRARSPTSGPRAASATTRRPRPRGATAARTIRARRSSARIPIRRRRNTTRR